MRDAPASCMFAIAILAILCMGSLIRSADAGASQLWLVMATASGALLVGAVIARAVGAPRIRWPLARLKLATVALGALVLAPILGVALFVAALTAFPVLVLLPLLWWWSADSIGHEGPTAHAPHHHTPQHA